MWPINDSVRPFSRQSESCIVYIQIAFQISLLFNGASSKFFLPKYRRRRKAPDLCRLVAPYTRFVRFQENKKPLSRTQRVVSSLKKDLVSRNDLRDIELNIDAKGHDVLITNFLQWETTIAQTFCLKLWSLLKKEGLFIKNLAGKGVPKD